MSFNPFLERPISVEQSFLNWDQIYPESVL